MDKLYDNLDNYEDENIVDELRRENGELKCKLEEYSVAIDKLQKDFDKLSSEFKKLEINYSSLLKTAKEEIERKTLIITNLNIEKDMMVLNAIQNKNVPNLRRMGRYIPMSRSKDQSIDLNITKVSNIESVKTRETTEKERIKQNHMSSEETMTSARIDIVSSCANKTVDRLRNTYQDAKENVVEVETKVSRPKPLSISSRRKSMPAVRSEVKFSSDEDEDSYCSTGNKYQQINHNIKPQNMLKTLHDKNRLLDDRHRTSETSSMDDKYFNYRESSKDYRTRNNRYDNYKNREKFDSQRSRHLSPERPRRTTRNSPNERNSRQEYTRHRVLESPPLDRFHSYQRRNREARSRYENNEYYHNKRNRDHSQDNYSSKHKSHHDNEEPLSKRRRNDSIHNREEEKGWDMDRGSIQISVSAENLSNMYCQSPDYSAIQDPATIQPIREIRNTAVTQLEDPRLYSNRYVSYQGDKGALITAVGRNVDLKVIDTSNWDIEHVEVPKALTRRPSQCSEDLVHNIYMDIDNPVSNISLESGEIETDDLEIFKTQQSFPYQPYNSDHVPNSIGSSKCSSASTEKRPIKDLSSYTIPKLRREPEAISSKFSNDTKQVENKATKEIYTDNIPEKKATLMTENVLSSCKSSNDTKEVDNKLSQEICTGNIPKNQSTLLTKNVLPCSKSSNDTKQVKNKASQEICTDNIPKKESTLTTENVLPSSKSSNDTKQVKNKASQEICTDNIPKKQSTLITENVLPSSTSSNDTKQVKNKASQEICSDNIPKKQSTLPTENVLSTSKSSNDTKQVKNKARQEIYTDNIPKKESTHITENVLPSSKSSNDTKQVKNKASQEICSDNIPKKQSTLITENVLSSSKSSNDPKQVKNKASIEICTDNIPEKQSTLVTENVLPKNELSEKYNSNNNNGLTLTVDRDEFKTHEFEHEHLKLTNKPTVEGDLELSDETSDNIDIQKEIIPEDEFTTFKDVPKSNQVECNQIQTHNDNKTTSEDTSKENTKATRSKRKTQKKELVKKEEVEKITEKRTRPKRPKKEAKEIKEKFSELFGDTTSSLITPEDLGIPDPLAQRQSSDKYILICEDAQDAVFMKPLESDDTTAPLPKLISYDTNNMTVEKNKEIETIVKCKTNKLNYDTKKKKIKKTEIERTVSTNKNEIHSEPSDDSPEHNIKSLHILNEDQPDSEKIADETENVPTLKPGLLKALATSTPHKEIIENPVAPNTDCVNNFKHDIVVSVDDTATDQFSNNETLDSQTELDAPDVRIFVKRRRKIVRKSNS